MPVYGLLLEQSQHAMRAATVSSAYQSCFCCLDRLDLGDTRMHYCKVLQGITA